MKATPAHAAIGVALITFAAAARRVHAQPVRSPAPDQKIVDFFETKIRPILAENCFSCHGPKKQKAGLRLDSAAGFFKGSSSGPVLVKGDPEKSLVIQAVRHAGDLRMPPKPKKKLPDQAIADLAAWVKLGAPWPDAGDQQAASGKDDAAGKNHWAFQPLRRPLPPATTARWPLTPVDLFILAELEKKGLKPSPPTDRRSLIRRATFDLLGLPPTADEIAAFEADTSPDAFAKVVDRLIASPHYGERWGRHWLDVARYADTKGYVFTQERRYPYSYTYRDYVIRAFNQDLPYDRFILEQLAADRLVAHGEADRKSLAAMGFLTLGRRFLNNIHDIIDDRIDVVGRGLLGLTVGCARCHDHKYDPIPTSDYYSLYGVFASSVEPKALPLVGEPERSAAYMAYETKLKELQGAAAAYREKHQVELSKGNRKFHEGLTELEQKADHWQATSKFAPPRAMVLEDMPQPVNPHVLLRGNPGSPGPAVPRQFLYVVAGPQRKPFHEGSGRLELARAVASSDNPLTARVLINRLWLHHFGAGLVHTPSDFGLRSEPPTHPELLDYLASRFMQDGWSIKRMHRLIMLSRVYQQSSDAQPAVKVDPENRYLWRFNRRRLDFEALRDSLLAVSGRLDRKMGGGAVDIVDAPAIGRRTVYGFIDRQNLPGLFRTFDFASPDATSPGRHETTVPQQALFLLNNPFVLEQARSLLKRREVAAAQGTAERIRVMHRLLYGRDATSEEVANGEHFLAAADPGGLTPWERYGQVLLLANELVFVD
jgi:mono/diheme cytochrome c family protein